MSFRDRFFTPQVARAVTSPLGIVLAGAGASVGIVTGLGPIGAVVLGAVAWAGRVGVAIPRGPRLERIDPFRLQDPWRSSVQAALRAKDRFDRTVRSTPSGPLHEDLAAVGVRIATGVRECWRIASRGNDIDGALAALDTAGAKRQLDALASTAASDGVEGSNADLTVQALQAQLRSAERLGSVSTDARNRLRLLNARLDEAVARAVELSLAGETADSLVGGLTEDVDVVVGELETLRQALEEAGRSSAPGGATA